MEEGRRTKVVAELDQGKLKAKGRVGGREGNGSDAYGNFINFHLIQKGMYRHPKLFLFYTTIILWDFFRSCNYLTILKALKFKYFEGNTPEIIYPMNTPCKVILQGNCLHACELNRPRFSPEGIFIVNLSDPFKIGRLAVKWHLLQLPHTASVGASIWLVRTWSCNLTSTSNTIKV